MPPAGLLRNALVLGLISAIGPFAIDMYLPALPNIGADLNAESGAVQMSLLTFFIAAAISQLFYGPLSDMYGRKVPLYSGLMLFAIGCVGAALSTSIDMLVSFRFLQGVGAAAGMVIPRAIVRDLYTGVDAARLMSLLMLVFSVSPIMAPLSGSLIIDTYSWRAVFWIVLVAAIAGIILLALWQKETRPVAARLESNLNSALSGYGVLIKDRNFIGLVMIGAMCMAGFMVYLANSSFVFIEQYGFTPREYALAFSVNAISFIGMSQLNGILASRFGLKRVVLFSVSCAAIILTAMLVLVLSGAHSYLMIASFLFAGFGFLGLVIPTTAVLALEDHGKIAGTASALMGTLQFLVAALAIGISSVFSDGTILPMVAGITLSIVTAFVLTLIVLRKKPKMRDLQSSVIG
ncbi:multidrug effflux MFS transporter [Paenochrobactrum pullorum]|uniref:multidrug effflux MFS transporter n=1 Tax=Paenochrobactrum pullorum TaxID=1324351 RepID=UPI0035BBF1EB